MSGPSTMPRRGFLSALAALPAAAAVTVPAIAAPTPADPEVAELSGLLEAAERRTAAASEAGMAADERYTVPAIPEALFQQPGDPLLMVFHPRRGPGGRMWYGTPERIADLREWSISQPSWKAERQRRAEILAAYDGWRADIKAREDAAGITATTAEFTAAVHAEKPIRARILALRSSDPAVLRLKVRAFISCASSMDWREQLDTQVNTAIEREEGPWEDAMAASILRDIVTAYAA